MAPRTTTVYARLALVSPIRISALTFEPNFSADCFGELASILHDRTLKSSPTSSKSSWKQDNGHLDTAHLMSKLLKATSEEEIWDILKGLDARSLLHVALDQVSR